jgi:hypothetical protein
MQMATFDQSAFAPLRVPDQRRASRWYSTCALCHAIETPVIEDFISLRGEGGVSGAWGATYEGAMAFDHLLLLLLLLQGWCAREFLDSLCQR